MKDFLLNFKPPYIFFKYVYLHHYYGYTYYNNKFSNVCRQHIFPRFSNNNDILNLRGYKVCYDINYSNVIKDSFIFSHAQSIMFLYDTYHIFRSICCNLMHKDNMPLNNIFINNEIFPHENNCNTINCIKNQYTLTLYYRNMDINNCFYIFLIKGHEYYTFISSTVLLHTWKLVNFMYFSNRVKLSNCSFTNILYLQVPNYAMRIQSSQIKGFNIFYFYYISNHIYAMQYCHYLLLKLGFTFYSPAVIVYPLGMFLQGMKYVIFIMKHIHVELQFYKINCHFLITKIYYKIIFHVLNTYQSLPYKKSNIINAIYNVSNLRFSRCLERCAINKCILHYFPLFDHPMSVLIKMFKNQKLYQVACCILICVKSISYLSKSNTITTDDHTYGSHTSYAKFFHICPGLHNQRICESKNMFSNSKFMNFDIFRTSPYGHSILSNTSFLISKWSSVIMIIYLLTILCHRSFQYLFFGKSYQKESHTDKYIYKDGH